MNIEQIIDKEFRGNVLIVQNDKVICNIQRGYRDLSNKIPNTVDTRFASASAGKVFVAVAILQLIEQGKIDFQSTIGEILDIDLHQIDPKVTVRELLTHTSGVPDYFDESVMEEYEELWTDFPNYKIRHNADLLPLFIDKPMMYQRGEKFQYNNSGYVLLAMLIEKITGEDFDQYLQKNVFYVCGMTATGYYELDRLPEKCANNYIYDEARKDYRTNIFCVDAKGTGAGGAFITVADIVKFWEGVRDHKLFSKEMTEEMFVNQTGSEDLYGYGVWIRKDENGNQVPYFQGCDPGVSFISEYNPNKNVIAVVVSNYGDSVWKEMRKIREALS